MYRSIEKNENVPRCINRESTVDGKETKIDFCFIFIVLTEQTYRGYIAFCVVRFVFLLLSLLSICILLLVQSCKCEIWYIFYMRAARVCNRGKNSAFKCMAHIFCIYKKIWTKLRQKIKYSVCVQNEGNSFNYNNFTTLTPYA